MEKILFIFDLNSTWLFWFDEVLHTINLEGKSKSSWWKWSCYGTLVVSDYWWRKSVITSIITLAISAQLFISCNHQDWCIREKSLNIGLHTSLSRLWKCPMYEDIAVNECELCVGKRMKLKMMLPAPWTKTILCPKGYSFPKACAVSTVWFIVLVLECIYTFMCNKV